MEALHWDLSTSIVHNCFHSPLVLSAVSLRVISRFRHIFPIGFAKDEQSIGQVVNLTRPKLATTSLRRASWAQPHCHAVNEGERIEVTVLHNIGWISCITSKLPTVCFEFLNCFLLVFQCIQVQRFVFWMERDDLQSGNILFLCDLRPFHPRSLDTVPWEDGVCAWPVGPTEWGIFRGQTTLIYNNVRNR